MKRYIHPLGLSANRIREYLVHCTRIDTRSLAVFRILAGLLVIADIFLRARNFSLYYTDDGIVPQTIAQAYTAEHAVSVYYFVSDEIAIAGIFALTLLVAVSLVIGYHTRAATVLTFILVLSLDHHNPFVLSYADTLFRLLLFWAIFLPLGERWSVDAVHADGTPRSSVAGVASFIILAQMVMMYLQNGVHKTESALWRTGEAAHLIFGIDEMTFFLGEFLGEFPTLLTFGGVLWFYLLLGSWLLIILHGRLRLPLVGLLIGGNLSFAVTVRIGAFPFVSIAGLVLFLQPTVWQDGRRFCKLIEHWFAVNPIEYVPWATLATLSEQFPDLHSKRNDYDRLTSAVYNVGFAAVLCALMFVIAVFILNFGTIMHNGYDQEQLNDEVKQAVGGEQIYTVAQSLGITQPEWTVFAPHPRTTDRYYVFGATTTNDTKLDVYNDRKYTFDRPEPLQEQHRSYRGRFFMNSIRDAGSNSILPELYAEHLCTLYREERGVELRVILMWEVTEDITPATVTDPHNRTTDREIFHTHTCAK